MSVYYSCSETAVILRSALKEAFGSHKFSVRSRTYAGGASIDVDWINGPTVKMVEALTLRFQ